MYSKLAAFTSLIAAARAQNFCTQTTETHPSLSWQRCASGGSCSSVSGSVVIDSNWRWTHTTSGTTNCYTGNTWDNTLCPNNQACTQNCCIDGADYSSTYGVTTSGNSLNLKFVTNGPYSKNIGSRLYLMASDSKYQMFNLLGNEFTFDVDVSNIGCGLNGALYFVNMDEDGGMARFPTNKAGAKYGTGYCDSQCPSDVKFINGQANREGWVSSSNDANAGTGGLGACCGEMDIWEANKISSAYTPHPCVNTNYHSCVGNSCGGTYSTDRYAGDCDPDGCDFNSWRQGNRTFYGPGSSFTVNTEQKMTVVTQFLTSGGALSEIKRFYVQNGKVIPNSQSTIAGVSGNSITANYCSAQKVAFGDTNSFAAKGGMTGSSAMLSKPMVLVMSLWDDHYANMLWLDSTYPTTSTKVGASRGSCATTSGVPADLESQVPNSNVIFSNIKFGPIGSTFSSTGGGTNPSTTTPAQPGTTTTPPSGGGTVPQWGQCGGNNWTGATSCVSPFTCTKINDWYSQCL